MARALPHKRLLLLGQAGNRSDAAIAELAHAAAAALPNFVVIKELPEMLRGRPPGEVPASQRQRCPLSSTHRKPTGERTRCVHQLGIDNRNGAC